MSTSVLADHTQFMVLEICSTLEIGLTIISDGHCMELTQEIFAFIFPQGVFEWFDLTEGTRDGDTTAITCEEKDMPPLPDEHKHQKIVARKFHPITVTDFPHSGRPTRLTFRRRYGQLVGQQEYLKRDITLVFPGTQLEHEFAALFKENGRDGSSFAGRHCQIQKIPVKELDKQYKHHLSGFTTWRQRDHADTWMLFPENIGPQLSIDEVAVTNGELYTVLTNNAAHGKQGAWVARVEGTNVCAITPILAKIPFEKRSLVTDVTLDMSESMKAMVTQAFPRATLVLGFHVQRLVSEAVQDIRSGVRREASKDENQQIKHAHQERNPYRPG